MKNAWNDNWRDELETRDYLCYIRLCECRNTRPDMIKMAKLMYKYNKWADPEDCLIRMMEWMDMNSQFYLADLTQTEFNEAIEKIKNFA